MKFIHKFADVQTNKIGENSNIWQFSVILKDAIIGENCNICAHTFIENDVIIKNNVTIKCGVYIWDGITIENNVQVGPNVTFTNDKYPRAKQNFELKHTLVRENASIGAGAVILCGIIIGENALIGAGAVVTKNVPPYTLWVGNPAKQVGFVTKDAKILSMELLDKMGNKYKIVNGEPIL